MPLKSIIGNNSIVTIFQAFDRVPRFMWDGDDWFRRQDSEFYPSSDERSFISLWEFAIRRLRYTLVGNPEGLLWPRLEEEKVRNTRSAHTAWLSANVVFAVAFSVTEHYPNGLTAEKWMDSTARGRHGADDTPATYRLFTWREMTSFRDNPVGVAFARRMIDPESRNPVFASFQDRYNRSGNDFDSSHNMAISASGPENAIMDTFHFRVYTLPSATQEDNKWLARLRKRVSDHDRKREEQPGVFRDGDQSYLRTFLLFVTRGVDPRNLRVNVVLENKAVIQLKDDRKFYQSLVDRKEFFVKPRILGKLSIPTALRRYFERKYNRDYESDWRISGLFRLISDVRRFSGNSTDMKELLHEEGQDLMDLTSFYDRHRLPLLGGFTWTDLTKEVNRLARSPILTRERLNEIKGVWEALVDVGFFVIQHPSERYNPEVWLNQSLERRNRLSQDSDARFVPKYLFDAITNSLTTSFQGDEAKETLSEFLNRVPLDEALREYVWSFGFISSVDENVQFDESKDGGQRLNVYMQIVRETGSQLFSMPKWATLTANIGRAGVFNDELVKAANPGLPEDWFGEMFNRRQLIRIANMTDNLCLYWAVTLEMRKRKALEEKRHFSTTQWTRNPVGNEVESLKDCVESRTWRKACYTLFEEIKGRKPGLVEPEAVFPDDFITLSRHIRQPIAVFKNNGRGKMQMVFDTAALEHEGKAPGRRRVRKLNRFAALDADFAVAINADRLDIEGVPDQDASPEPIKFDTTNHIMLLLSGPPANHVDLLKGAGIVRSFDREDAPRLRLCTHCMDAYPKSKNHKCPVSRCEACHRTNCPSVMLSQDEFDRAAIYKCDKCWFAFRTETCFKNHLTRKDKRTKVGRDFIYVP